ncbi:hypothetical protein D3C84_753430 [compost metagenome]
MGDGPQSPPLQLRQGGQLLEHGIELPPFCQRRHLIEKGLVGQGRGIPVDQHADQPQAYLDGDIGGRQHVDAQAVQGRHGGGRGRGEGQRLGEFGHLCLHRQGIQQQLPARLGAGEHQGLLELVADAGLGSGVGLAGVAQRLRPRLAVDLAQTILIEEGAGALLIELDLPPASIALLHLANVQLAQGLDRGIRVPLVVAKGLLVDGDGPAMTTVVFTAITDALEMLNETRSVERGCHVAVR